MEEITNPCNLEKDAQNDATLYRIPSMLETALQRKFTHQSHILLETLEQNQAAHKIQTVIRKFLYKDHLFLFPRREVKHWIYKLNKLEAGFNDLFTFMVLVCLYFVIYHLRFTPAWSYSVNRSMKDLISSTRFQSNYYSEGELKSQAKSMEEISSVSEFNAWLKSFYAQIYNSNQIESTCNLCNMKDFITNKMCPSRGSKNQSSCLFEVERNLTNLCSSDECRSFYGISEDIITADLWLPFDQSSCDNYLWTHGLTEAHADKLMSEVSFEYRYGNRVANTNHVLLGTILVIVSNYQLGTCMNDRVVVYEECYTDAEMQIKNITAPPGSKYLPETIDFMEAANGYALIYNMDSVGLGYTLCQMEEIERLGDDLIGKRTKEIQIIIPIYNGQKESGYGFGKITISFEQGGRVQCSFDVMTFPLRNMYSTSMDMVRFVLESIFLWAVIVQFTRELNRNFYILKHGRLSLKRILSWKEIFNISFRELSSLACYLLFFSNLFVWINWTFQIKAVYEKSGMFEYLEGARLEYADMMSLSEDIIHFTNAIQSVAETWNGMKVYVTITSLFALLKIIKLFEFNERLSLVGQSISNSFWRLFHFSLIFLLIQFFFSYVCALIFGSYIESFSSFDRSFNQLLTVCFGGFPEVYPALYEEGGVLGLAVIVVFQLLQNTLMLTLLVSVLLEGYTIAQAMETEETIIMSLCFYIGRLWSRCFQRKWVSKIETCEEVSKGLRHDSHVFLLPSLMTLQQTKDEIQKSPMTKSLCSLISRRILQNMLLHRNRKMHRQGEDVFGGAFSGAITYKIDV